MKRLIGRGTSIDMEGETFRLRIAKLMQKSRKALRLYSSMGRGGAGRGSEFKDLQVQEWKSVNAELLRKLALVLEEQVNARKLVTEIFALRDAFYNDWRAAEAEVHTSHKELVFASESGDFVRAAHLSRSLIVLKARVQATQAAHHEIQSVIDQSKVSQPTIELSHEQIVQSLEASAFEAPVSRVAKVIPLIQRGR